jgi:hypothetical protein
VLPRVLESGLVLHHTLVGVHVSACKEALCCSHAVSALLCVALCWGALRVCAEEGIVLSAAAAGCFMQMWAAGVSGCAGMGYMVWGFWRAFLLYQHLVHAEG